MAEERLPTLADAAARELIRHELGATMLVEAAAGTGKTTEMVRRMVAVLETGRATVESLVGVTFTEKAAGELRLRLRSELEMRRHELAVPGRTGAAGSTPHEEVGGSTAHRQIEDALARLEEARLGTIHGFCADLLRERSVEAGVDPEFQTLDEGASQRLFREAFAGWLEEQLANPPEGVRRSLRRLSKGAPPGAVGLVRRTPDEGPIDRLRKAAWSLADWRDLRAPWGRPADFDRSVSLSALVEQLRQFADLTRRASKPEVDVFFRETEPARRLADEIAAAEAVRPRDPDGLESAFVELVHQRSLGRVKGYGREYGPGLPRATVQASRDALIESVRQFQQDADADLAALLQQELLGAVDRYEALKRRRGRVDFLDLLLGARDLLVARPDVRATYQNRYSHLFVDEFQDTDPLQAEILLLLAADDPGQGDWGKVCPRPGKLFLVGDPKQSIYRFRRADVGIYHDVKEMLARSGARVVHLSTSFRSVPQIQNLINVAFAPWMHADRGTLQAEYVPLSPFRQGEPGQPAVVALPVPAPLSGSGWVTKSAIEGSLPQAVGAFVHWLVEKSGWSVTERERPAVRVPIQPRHVCLLFRRLHSFFAGDVTRPYVEALEARGVRHLLVGGRSFHDREEVETMRAALCAIEWPEDELSIFATLRGSLFGIGDEELLRYRSQFHRLHPYRIPDQALPEALLPIAQGLAILRQLHQARNYRPIADTVASLLASTRAHAGFALRPSGEQVLANVLYLGELARQYESEGGISFRGFLDRLLEDAEAGRAAEAPILEDGSDGVRVMTIHKAKGLEFPVVILADPTESLAHGASRFLDPARNLCAMRIGGWSPALVLDYADVERGRDESEGVRLAYVAATRARDLLVVPTLAQGEHQIFSASESGLGAAGWLAPIAESLYPTRDAWSRATPAPGCPSFAAAEAPGFEVSGGVHPGLHSIEYEDDAGLPLPTVEVVWWDPSHLELEADPLTGMRREDLIAKGDDESAIPGAERYRRWQSQRESRIAAGSVPQMRVLTATAWAESEAAVSSSGAGESGTLVVTVEDVARVEVVTLARASRPGGARFGSLVHAVLAAVSLRGDPEEISRVARLQARILGARADEEKAAREVARAVLEHPLLQSAARAHAEGRCRRETPVLARLADGTCLDGVIDLAFHHDEEWTVVDFKTDRDLAAGLANYRRQVALYACAIALATGRSARGVILRI